MWEVVDQENAKTCVRTLATSEFLKPCSVATASQSTSALFLVFLTMLKNSIASAAVGSFLGSDMMFRVVSSR